ncbi:tuberin [Condylostylus longicornis]|uniref:tuberin n=1 Tax=Condylostylus longicornis TaxID=2530218 RepID=UPI00244E544E|nr:tuberin [Condylostylus longicornis]
MSSKDKDNALNKLRHFFKASKTGVGVKERELGPELERELRPENPVAQRCKTLKDLGEMVLTTKLEDAAICKLWELTKDLIVDNKSTEHRQITLTFYKKLIQGQYANLSLMREHFFLVIQKHEVMEDLRHRLDLLIALTENGKDITNFEEKIGKLMLQWAPLMIGELMEPYLEVLENIVKFNAAHLDNEIIVGIVNHVCNLSCNTEVDEIGLQCLKVLDAVICYTIFPNETLALCVVTLCRTINVHNYCQTSWKNMKKLLGTNLGYASLLIMCSILKDKNFYGDEFLLRGAVFHITMGVFVYPAVTMTSMSPVLTSFYHALNSQKVHVTYEVILSISLFVDKFGKDLSEHVWDVVCDILLSIADNIYFYECNGMSKENALKTKYHEAIDKIEDMLHSNEICINTEVIYDLIEKIAESRPIQSVLNLIEYRSLKISATRPEWLQILREFIQRFYHIPNTEIRVETVYALIKIMDTNRAGYEEEILERVVIPEFHNISSEEDLKVRNAVAKALTDFSLHCETKRCGELLDILEKILNRPFEVFGEDGTVLQSETELDVLTVVEGLIEVFMVKLYKLPSCHAIRIFKMLIEHLEKHYKMPKVFEQSNAIREKIFSWMLKARASHTYHIGFPDPSNNGTIRYSHYLGIDSKLSLSDVTYQHQISTQSNLDTIPPINFTAISIRPACKLIVICLEKEKDYQVFQMVLKELPNILQNKAIIQGNDIESLANALWLLFCSKKDRKFLKAVKPSSDDLSYLILPAMASLVIYHQFLRSKWQNYIIETLKIGVFQRVANICINTLTIMILEMPEVLMRKLPDVLLEMSKMSDNVQVAIPVLEFLSILSRLPNNLFTNFVPLQYMYVFAITLPYTKPQKYDHYVVSLAYHVIAGWFLKCKLTFRKNFVNYIISSIQSNLQLFEENKITSRSDFQVLNEDSSSRKRSTSLTERSSHGRNIKAGESSSSNLRPLMNEGLKHFHTELAETCIDFLARHTFSPCSALPKRLPAVQMLLKDGISQHWIVGQNIVTITTSGCGSAPTRNGLCERCQIDKNASVHSVNKLDSNSINSFGVAPSSPEVLIAQTKDTSEFQNKRYTKASLQYSSGTDSGGSIDLTSSTSSSSQHPTSLDGGINKLRQTSNSSSGSLETLPRRGSNPDSIENRVENNRDGIVSQHPFQQHVSTATTIQQPVCARSCTGWAEILIRRATGNISWIMRIQNPIANDCLGNDIPFNDLIGLFMPSHYGGVFGPKFLNENKSFTSIANADIIDKAVETSLSKETGETFSKEKKMEQNEHSTAKAVAKLKLKRQEEITSSLTGTSGPIDIPKKIISNKESAGSFSDVEPDEDENNDDLPFDDCGRKYSEGSRSRNPVRRVNSSPEMSSSWRSPFTHTKGSSKSESSKQWTDGIVATVVTVAAHQSEADEINSENIIAEQLQKKKMSNSSGFSKDMRVSCEAIPEEIPGSTPPSHSDLIKSHIVKNTENNKSPLTITSNCEKNDRKSDSLNTNDIPVLPPKQHSADDVTSQPATYNVTTSASTTSLKIPLDIQKLSTKPPQSPIPLSPRLLAKNAANKIASFAPNVGDSSGGDNGDMPRVRSKTISVVREVNRNSVIRSTPTFRQRGPHTPPSNLRLGIDPSFIFLQLFHTGQLQCIETPIKINQENTNAVKLLDLIPPFETHKIGVLYVGPGQCNNETEILKNRYGSLRYFEFLRNIGTLISLKEGKEHNFFVGMEENGKDGLFTYVWKDDTVHVTFHVATLMPNKENDPNCNQKKLHIGNDYVSIVYNESGEEYNLQTIKGQFNYACVVVQPLELNANKVFVKARKEIANFVCHPDPKIVSDRSAPLLARQLALHANLASHVYQSLKSKNPYASNWLERLRKIKNIRAKLLRESHTSTMDQDTATSASGGVGTSGSSGDVSKIHRPNMHDFTKYT